MIITRLPVLGTSWYERRFSYWCRRTGAVALLAIAVTVYTLIIAGVILAAGPPGSPGFLAVLSAESAFTIVTGIWSFRHLWRLGGTGRALRSNRAAGSAGASAGLAFRAGGAGGALLVVGTLLTAGVVLAALVMWLTPILPAERYARQRMEEDLRVRQHAPLHGPGRSSHHRRKR